MHIESKRDWIAALDTAVSIPTVPFRDGGVDFAGHQKNIEYLLANKALSGGRPRIICLAGTSLIHHMSCDDQVRLIEGGTGAPFDPPPPPAVVEEIRRAVEPLRIYH